MNLNFQSVVSWTRRHRKSTAVFALGIMLVSFAVVRAFSGSLVSASYVLTDVSRGTLVASVTGNGQIAATSQIALNPKGSGTLTYVAAVNGKWVRSGTIIASLDATSEAQSVQDAQLDLQEARITLQKLERSQVSSVPEREDDVAMAYADAYDVVFDVFQELPGIRDALDESLTDGSLNDRCHSSICEHETDGLSDAARNEFEVLDSSYDDAYRRYRATDRLSSRDSIAKLVDETIRVSDLLARSLKAEQNILDAYIDDLGSRNQYVKEVAAFEQRLADSESAVTALSRHSSALQTARRDIADTLRVLVDARDTAPLDLASQRNSVKRADLSLQKARTALGERSVRAPFDGVVTGLDARRGESVTSGTTLGSLLTNRHVAELTFNEVDIAQLADGQKVTLTFDAVEDLTLTGTVAAIDTLGTVSQGVVSYTVQVALDTEDARIKPGMSVGATIVTDVRTDVLIVPIGAVKGSDGDQYVQIPGNGFPVEAAIGIPVAWAGAVDELSVTVGLTNDTEAEILTGLTEGTRIIARTVATSSDAATQAPSLFQTGGATRGGTGGGGIRTNIR